MKHGLIFFSIVAFSFAPQASRWFDLKKPAAAWHLPDTLREISGITLIDSSHVACVQDENGIVFVYDLRKRRISRAIPFAGAGDYEGIAAAGESLYVLRSDGQLFEISSYRGRRPFVKSFSTGIPVHDNEGLCYDRISNRLLIGCKAPPAPGDDRRLIYSLDLGRPGAQAVPAFTISVADAFAFARDHQVPVKMVKAVKGPGNSLRIPKFDIAISEICMKDGMLYVLSSADKYLFTLNASGAIERMESLDRSLFGKPEGLTFTENGDLLISNETTRSGATILRLSRKD